MAYDKIDLNYLRQLRAPLWKRVLSKVGLFQTNPEAEWDKVINQVQKHSGLTKEEFEAALKQQEYDLLPRKFGRRKE